MFAFTETDVWRDGIDWLFRVGISKTLKRKARYAGLFYSCVGLLDVIISSLAVYLDSVWQQSNHVDAADRLVKEWGAG